MYNIMMFNPGYVGSKNAICATALTASNGGVLKGHRLLLYLRLTLLQAFGSDHGAGLHILSDRIGFETNLSINVSYAYRMDAGAGKLGIGAGIWHDQFHRSMPNGSFPAPVIRQRAIVHTGRQ
jgi:hypothetical protein